MKKAELGIGQTCQKCLKRVASTSSRTIRTKLYQGPCGDSFCYHSCDLEACHPIHVTVCDACAKKLAGAK